jgi:hypothetical protein
VQAAFKDGVLEVTMPAPQRQARGRQIDIQGASQGASAPHGAGQAASAPKEQEPTTNTVR